MVPRLRSGSEYLRKRVNRDPVPVATLVLGERARAKTSGVDERTVQANKLNPHASLRRVDLYWTVKLRTGRTLVRYQMVEDTTERSTAYAGSELVARLINPIVRTSDSCKRICTVVPQKTKAHINCPVSGKELCVISLKRVDVQSSRSSKFHSIICEKPSDSRVAEVSPETALMIASRHVMLGALYRKMEKDGTNG